MTLPVGRADDLKRLGLKAQDKSSVVSQHKDGLLQSSQGLTPPNKRTARQRAGANARLRQSSSSAESPDCGRARVVGAHPVSCQSWIMDEDPGRKSSIAILAKIDTTEQAHSTAARRASARLRQSSSSASRISGLRPRQGCAQPVSCQSWMDEDPSRRSSIAILARIDTTAQAHSTPARRASACNSRLTFHQRIISAKAACSAHLLAALATRRGKFCCSPSRLSRQ